MFNRVVDITPEEVALEFMNASDTEQAAVINEMARLKRHMKEDNPEIVWALQFDWVWNKLTPEGKAFLRYLVRE